MLRIILFLATNMAILVLLGIVMSVLGIDSRSTSGLLVMAGMFGMGGRLFPWPCPNGLLKNQPGQGY
nr:hypothetical protein [Desulfomarina profundi]